MMDNSSLFFYKSSCIYDPQLLPNIVNLKFEELRANQYCFDPDAFVVCIENNKLDTSITYSAVLFEQCNVADYEIGIHTDELASTICGGSLLTSELMSGLDITKFLEGNIPNGAITARCLTHSCDLCVLFSEDALAADDFRKLEKLSEDWARIQKWRRRESDYVRFDEWRQRIIRRIETMNAYRSNPHYSNQIEVLENLVFSNNSHPDEISEYFLIAALLLQAMLIESRLRWLNDSGEFRYEDSYKSRVMERASALKLKDLKTFIDQSSVGSPNHDLIWSIVFISRGILASVLQQGTAVNVLDDSRKDFYGFLPIVSESSEELSSYYRDHMSPKYNIGFLSVPKSMSRSVLRFFPAYIHEFFHYLPPADRNSRNDVITRLCAISVLNPLYRHLCEKDADPALFSKIVDIVALWILAVEEVLEPDKTIKENHFDSMYYLFKMGSIYLVDFDEVYTKAVKELLPDDSEALGSVKDECLNLWKEDAENFMLTFTIALREIRSDISMYYLLWHSDEKGRTIDTLARYIAILASESGFAKTGAAVTADSSILRFGFMTRYILSKSVNIQEGDFNARWRKEVRFILKQLAEDKYAGKSRWATKEELEKITDKKLANLEDYIKEYGNIVFFKSPNKGFDRKYIRLMFETLLYPKPPFLPLTGADPKYVNPNGGLIGPWEEDLIKISKKSFLVQLKKIYTEYERAAITGNARRMYIIENNSRLIFRHLLYYCHDIAD